MLCQELVVRAIQDLAVADRGLCGDGDDVCVGERSHHDLDTAVDVLALEDVDVVPCNPGSPTFIVDQSFQLKSGKMVGQLGEAGLDMLGQIQTALGSEKSVLKWKDNLLILSSYCIIFLSIEFNIFLYRSIYYNIY